MSSSIERKLSAIVFTDIVGYTEISANDEESAFRLIEIQREILKPIVDEFDGNWLKEMGDGLLLSFPSSIQAVQCAIKIQTAIKPLNNLNLRIGIHQGDILQKGDDIFGDDVNVASRIQTEAPIGEIAISQKVEADISSHPKFHTNYIGSPKLKGVKQDIKVYSVSYKNENIQTSIPKQETLKSSGILNTSMVGIIITVLISILLVYKGIDYFSTTKEDTGKTSIAILDFENIRQLNEYEWLGDDIAGSLSYRLGETPNVRIIDRFQILNKLGEAEPEKASILDYKIKQIANNMDVDFILHGQFTIVQDQIKVRAFIANTVTFDQIPIMNEKYPLEELSDIPTYINDKISNFIKTDSRFKEDIE